MSLSNRNVCLLSLRVDISISFPSKGVPLHLLLYRQQRLTSMARIHSALVNSHIDLCYIRIGSRNSSGLVTRRSTLSSLLLEAAVLALGMHRHPSRLRESGIRHHTQKQACFDAQEMRRAGSDDHTMKCNLSPRTASKGRSRKLKSALTRFRVQSTTTSKSTSRSSNVPTSYATPPPGMCGLRNITFRPVESTLECSPRSRSTW